MSRINVKSILSWIVILFLISVAAVSIATWIVNVDSFSGSYPQADRACNLPGSEPCQIVISGKRHVRF
ncbi:hypothetical protein ACSQ76_17845 [Roseovarius sp. B08]|uniref:hypothetical protein n=1 Tax=Roseovarius sp. B08 TaxID=3449223 RepID=UPI003EDBDADE